jgi:hypothetical protein
MLPRDAIPGSLQYELFLNKLNKYIQELEKEDFDKIPNKKQVVDLVDQITKNLDNMTLGKKLMEELESVFKNMNIKKEVTDKEIDDFMKSLKRPEPELLGPLIPLGPRNRKTSISLFEDIQKKDMEDRKKRIKKSREMI